MTKLRTLMSWSGGKDCALALDALRHNPAIEVVALVTGFCRDTGRIAVHEVRRDLIRQQAASLGLPLSEVELPSEPSNAQYESAWRERFQQWHVAGVRHVAFGDLFLEDIRAYRTRFLESIGLQAEFPLWGSATLALAERAAEAGLRAVVCSCDSQRLAGAVPGRLFDRQWIDDLPAGCDPCGENGEFHTFVFDGPGFSRPVPWSRGPVGRRGTVDFCDLLPVQLS